MNLCSKFRGSLVAGLLGDCFGAPFEGEINISNSLLNSYFNKHNQDGKVLFKNYTDDTVLTRCIAESLIQRKHFDAKDIAQRFTENYFLEPNRGYGGNVVDVFAMLKETNFKDVLEPASKQFNGTGSYGNGAAMRIAPIALFCHSKSTESLINLSKQTSLITHAHILGYNGAILQSIAVNEVLKHTESSFNRVNFVDDLITKMKEVEKYSENEDAFYVSSLQKLNSLLERGNDVTVNEVQIELGNDVSAKRSVPTALYVFLRALSPIPGVETDNPIQRTIHYAISLGGDTDTIAAMAGNVAGAFYGEDCIPKTLKLHCEDVDTIISFADRLYELVKLEQDTRSQN